MSLCHGKASHLSARHVQVCPLTCKHFTVPLPTVLTAAPPQPRRHRPREVSQAPPCQSVCKLPTTSHQLSVSLDTLALCLVLLHILPRAHTQPCNNYQASINIMTDERVGGWKWGSRSWRRGSCRVSVSLGCSDILHAQQNCLLDSLRSHLPWPAPLHRLTHSGCSSRLRRKFLALHTPQK